MTCFPIFGLPQPFRPTWGPKFELFSCVFHVYLIFFSHFNLKNLSKINALIAKMLLSGLGTVFNLCTGGIPEYMK